MAKTHNADKEIKQALITVPTRFNKLQRDAIIEESKDAGLEIYKLINEPTASTIAYGNIIQSDNERKVLIFDLGKGIFDVSIVKIKGNEYIVLALIGEEHLGGEDFNQRIIEYVMREIKKNNKFKDIDFNNKKK
jgi:molecular chaperone DnaK